jgi:hypothetical protein
MSLLLYLRILSSFGKGSYFTFNLQLAQPVTACLGPCSSAEEQVARTGSGARGGEVPGAPLAHSEAASFITLLTRLKKLAGFVLSWGE